MKISLLYFCLDSIIEFPRTFALIKLLKIIPEKVWDATRADLTELGFLWLTLGKRLEDVVVKAIFWNCILTSDWWIYKINWRKIQSSKQCLYPSWVLILDLYLQAKILLKSQFMIHTWVSAGVIDLLLVPLSYFMSHHLIEALFIYFLTKYCCILQH